MRGRCLSIMKRDIYIKLDNHVRTGHKEICLKDVASVYCGDGDLKTRAEQVVIFSFDGEEKEVISILYIYEKLYEAVGEDIQMHSIGESDCVIDLTDGKRPPKLWSKIQVVFVSLVTFFGAAFSIMTYNEDAGVPDVFKTLYEMILGEPSGNGVLEVTYSVGIALGVIIFFHHFEKKGRRDPTAMEIQMDKYEKDVVEAYVKSSDRRGKSLDVGE